MKHVPMIQTARLRLEPITEADRDALHRLMTLEPVRRYLCDGESVPVEVVEGWIAASTARFESQGSGLWAVRFTKGDAIVGLTGFAEFYEPPVLELIFALDPHHWGHDLGTEMAAAVMHDAFTRLKVATIRASTDAPNVDSLSTLARLGMTESGRESDSHPLWEQIHFEVSAQDWLARE